jgi:preprotein translocase subunit SecE
MALVESTKRFFQESKQELKRVNWPDRQTTIRYTVFVIGLSLALAVFLGVIDYALLAVLKATVL